MALIPVNIGDGAAHVSSEGGVGLYEIMKDIAAEMGEIVAAIVELDTDAGGVVTTLPTLRTIMGS